MTALLSGSFMFLRPVGRLTIAWCHATSFRRSIVRLAWTGVGW